MRFSLALLIASLPAFALADDARPLFDGKSLTGWMQRNGTASYRIEEDCIVGKTSEGSPNSFLFTEKPYGDFELSFEVKVDDDLNSGVQIRSASIPEKDGGRVHGPQVEISTDGCAGFVYGEGLGTGWLTKEADGFKGKLDKSPFKAGEWNKYTIVAKGKSIKTTINGKPVADLVDETTGMMSGHIGLQVHGIPKGKGPYEVRWKNILIKELK
jgi:hypothetical protein